MSNPTTPNNPSNPSNPSNPNSPDNIGVNEPAQPQRQTPAQEAAEAQGPTIGQQTGSQTNASQASLRPDEPQDQPDAVTEGSELSFPASDPPAY